MLWLEEVVDQLVNNVVSVLVDKLQADGLQVGTNVVTDLSQKLGHGLENKMRKINKIKWPTILLLVHCLDPQYSRQGLSSLSRRWYTLQSYLRKLGKKQLPTTKINLRPVLSIVVDLG